MEIYSFMDLVYDLQNVEIIDRNGYAIYSGLANNVKKQGLPLNGIIDFISTDNNILQIFIR